MAQADLAIASFGMTAYELACMEVPALYFCLTADHAESCQAFVEAGMAMSFDDHNIRNKSIVDKIRLFISNKDVLGANITGTDLGLANGAAKVAYKIIKSMEENF
jgi:spore coat polysaccharide biosynthesis protein SpsF